MENTNYNVDDAMAKRVEVLEEGVMGINEPAFCHFCSPIVSEIK